MAPQRSYDDPNFDLNDELTQQRDERISPVVAVVGLIGIIVGVAFWGSLAMSILSAGEGNASSDTGPDRPPAAGEVEEEEAGIDCDDIEDASALSPAREAEYREQCATPEPEATAEPTPDTRTNREDCDTIRGTDYRSPEERQWFLANCVTQ